MFRCDYCDKCSSLGEKQIKVVVKTHFVLHFDPTNGISTPGTQIVREQVACTVCAARVTAPRLP